MMLSPSDSRKVRSFQTSHTRGACAARRRGGQVVRLAAKRIADSVNGSNEALMLRRVRNRPPDFANQDVQIRIDDIGVGPDARVQLALVDDFRPALEQDAQQVERFRGKVDLALVVEQLPGLGVDDERSELFSRWRLRSISTAANSRVSTTTVASVDPSLVLSLALLRNPSEFPKTVPTIPS